MALSRLRRRGIAWLMLVTVVMAALAPALSSAGATLRGDGAPWSVLCTASDAASAAVAPTDRSHPLQGHCPLCALHADGWGLPPGASCAIELPAFGPVLLVYRLQAPRPQPAWTRAPSRAPPRPA